MNKIPLSMTDFSITGLEDTLHAEKLLFEEICKRDFTHFSQVELEEIRSRFCGKKSLLQELLKSLASLSDMQQRKSAGALIHKFKQFIEAGIEDLTQKFRQMLEDQKLSAENDDITLPLPMVNIGSRHPIAVVMRDLLVPFQRMGFCVIDGPEIDSNFYNFDALNVKADHPAREMQDTFFLSSEWLLRTQTSNVQTHAMLERGLPLKIVCPGCVYRNEFDITHVPSFRQIECLVVDRGIHMGHLRYIINELLNAAFDRKVKIRFRSSYFPFTEPSAEVDVECQQCFGKGCRSCKHSGWSEIGGCGFVNQNVLHNCNIDSKIYSGIAFGFGVDRIAKDRFGISDLRSLFAGHLPFLSSFKLS